MPKLKAINHKKLVAFVLPIIRKEKLPMSEELKKLRHKQYIAEHKLTTAKHKEKRLQTTIPRQPRYPWQDDANERRHDQSLFPHHFGSRVEAL